MFQHCVMEAADRLDRVPLPFHLAELASMSSFTNDSIHNILVIMIIQARNEQEKKWAYLVSTELVIRQHDNAERAHAQWVHDIVSIHFPWSVSARYYERKEYAV